MASKTVGRNRTMPRMSRRNRPALEGLEGRQLLNGSADLTPSAADQGTTLGVPNQFRGISYVTAKGAKVQVQVLGNGSIQGTTVTPDGVLNLVYSGTNGATKIVIDVKRGFAPLGSVNELDVASNNYTGVGGQILGSLIGPKVDLIDNGQINMTSGIGRLQLHSIGRNTQIHLRELPQTTQISRFAPVTLTTTTTGAVTSTSSATTSATVTTTVSTQNPNPKPLPPGEVGVNQPAPYTDNAPASYTSQGRTMNYSNDADGGSTLTSISGQFSPGLNQVVYPGPIPPATVPPPAGVSMQVDFVNAGTPGKRTIGSGQVFGYDPVANTLIRFDERSGAALQTIDVGGTPTTAAGVGLGRNGRELVVLLGRGSTIQAFDAINGNPVGSFSIGTLAADGINAIDGIGFNEQSTVVMDYNGQVVPGTPNFGAAVTIDVTASLASGNAVPIGLPYNTSRSLELLGGIAAVPQGTSFYAAAAAHFDPFQLQPTNFQQGTVTLTGSTPGLITESTRTALPGKGTNPFINAGAYGSNRTSGVTRALGAFEQNLGLVTGVVNGQNVVQLYTPSNGSAGTVLLNNPNQLASISSSFHPELAGAALVDVQGNLQSFTGKSAHGLAINDNGNLNIVRIRSLSDSTIVGQPFSHLQVASRHNVVVITPNRSVGTRGGVIVDPNLKPLGPLSLPS